MKRREVERFCNGVWVLWDPPNDHARAVALRDGEARWRGGVVEYFQKAKGVWIPIADQSIPAEVMAGQFPDTTYRTVPYATWLYAPAPSSTQPASPAASGQAQAEQQKKFAALQDTLQVQVEQLKAFAALQDRERALTAEVSRLRQRESQMADVCGTTAQENKDLLVENARLRRSVEALDRKLKARK